MCFVSHKRHFDAFQALFEREGQRQERLHIAPGATGKHGDRSALRIAPHANSSWMQCA